MKLFSAVQIAFSLTACTITLASVVPDTQSWQEKIIVNIQENAPDKLEWSTANGVWFHPSTSRYCSPCGNLATLWNRLVEEVDTTPLPGVGPAQVHCFEDEALAGCRKGTVAWDPQMSLYRNGELVDVYAGPRAVQSLLEYLVAYAARPAQGSVRPPTPTAWMAAAEPSSASLEDHSAATRKGRHRDGLVLALDDETFQEHVDAGGVLVKFSAPWSYESRKLAPTWAQLAEEMQGKAVTIAEVDCDEHSALCLREGVTGVPVIFYYGADGAKTWYPGGRGLAALRAFAEPTSPRMKTVESGNVGDGDGFAAEDATDAPQKPLL
ncbi:hypothetical protein BN946_scf184697.g3 [Trametes cinnabarina]|uniref:Thioredoxin domain-containing protein n=1 Tax=Pycnoporus cinnabarinus TaxID=5643 RepID=A0A060S693_PYCCI|nr:hypothetical protein BN946_scf184697.g3 [Trametes cinnabarina]